MAIPVHNYNPRQVTCALGNHIVTGFADDSMISVEYAGDGTTHVQGADGEIVRSIDPTMTYTMKLTLQQTSATNSFLAEMFARDQRAGDGTFSVEVDDAWGHDHFSSPVAWVSKPSSWARGKQQQNREWELTCSYGEFEEGGE